ncbi:MAG: SMI1/KNR4 family protein [Geodermatophilaceae bacterium]
MALRWRDCAITPAPPVGNERLAEVQQRLGVIFPQGYLEVMRTHQGAAPDRSLVTLGDGTRTRFSMLMHLEDRPDGLDLLGVLVRSESLPDKVIPFAVDPGDYYFCFDFRATDVDPPVVFLATDDSTIEPAFLADSFSELIDSLQEG